MADYTKQYTLMKNLLRYILAYLCAFCMVICLVLMFIDKQRTTSACILFCIYGALGAVLAIHESDRD